MLLRAQVTDSQGNVDSLDFEVPLVEEAWDNIIENELVSGDLWLPEGQSTLIGPNVVVEGNVLVKGAGTVLAMRPGSSLTISGGDPSLYVGGNEEFNAAFENDLGIWVWDGGALDIQGTPKTSWNRTGSDPTWEPDDEYWIAPTDMDDWVPRRWFPGDPIPRVPIPPEDQAHAAAIGVPQDWIDHGIPAEIANVSRDVVIKADPATGTTGAGHIHVRGEVPQTIKHCRLEGLGVFKPGEGQVLGRYALHLHHGGDLTAGSEIVGVALVNSRGQGLVPHMANGVTIRDVVSVNSYNEALWWDIGDKTDDLLVEHMAVLGVDVDREIKGGTPRFDGLTLGKGQNIVMRDCAAAGVRDSKLSVGFDWPEQGHGVWDFSGMNIAHNNAGPGLRFWTNGADPHVSTNFVTYRNEKGGIESGAYRHAVRYEDALLIDDFIRHHTNAKGQDPGDDGPARYERVVVNAPSDKPAILVGVPKQPPVLYVEFVDCVLRPGTGQPKVRIMPLQVDDPWWAHFIDSDVQPSDFVFDDVASAEGTHIRATENGSLVWDYHVLNGVWQPI